MQELRSNSFSKRPELRESREKNNKKVKRVNNVQVNLKNKELFCPESNKSNLVNHWSTWQETSLKKRPKL